LKWKVEIEGITPLLMHRFIGMEESKAAKEKPYEQQAEAFAYRNKHGELAIPAGNMRACIVQAFYDSAGRGRKTADKNEAAARINVYSDYEDRMNLTLEPQEYEIDKRSAFSGSKNRGIRDWCIRPIMEEWSTVFILDERLGLPEDELLYKLQFAGTDVGVLSNRPNGFGRFKVTSLEEYKA